MTTPEPISRLVILNRIAGEFCSLMQDATISGVKSSVLNAQVRLERASSIEALLNLLEVTGPCRSYSAEANPWNRFDAIVRRDFNPNMIETSGFKDERFSYKKLADHFK
jgi:hypothetical protein